MSVSYRDLLKSYMRLVCELEGTDHFNQMRMEDFGLCEWEALVEVHAEMLDQELSIDL